MSNQKASTSNRHWRALQKPRYNKEQREEGWEVKEIGRVAITGDVSYEWRNGEEITLRRAAEWRQINLNDCFYTHNISLDSISMSQQLQLYELELSPTHFGRASLRVRLIFSISSHFLHLFSTLFLYLSSLGDASLSQLASS